MAIDLELTTNRALEEAGKIVRVLSIEPENIKRPFNPVDPKINCGFSCREGYYDMTWTFHKDSVLVKRLAEALEIQEQKSPSGQVFEAAQYELFKALAHSEYTGFPVQYAQQMDQDPIYKGYRIFFKITGGMPFGMSCTSAVDWLNNAIEHGSDFCKQGEVNARFYGGQNGFAFFIDQPGNGFRFRPLDEKEAQRLVSNQYDIDFDYREHQRRVYNERGVIDNDFFIKPARGIGLAGATLSKYPIINAFPFEGRFRTVVLYRLKDFI